MKLELIRRKTEVPGVESFVFRPAEPIAWKAGQYLHYVLHHEPTDDRGSDRWFTIASAPGEKDVMITTRIAAEKGSSFKAALAALQIGEQIEASDVDGDFVVPDATQEYVFIASGIGITPFRSILVDADAAGTRLKVTLLYANRDADVPYKEQLDSLQKNNQALAIRYVTAPELIDEAMIRSTVPDLQKPLFYVSGPAPMVMALSETLQKMGVPMSRIKLDDFPGYAAG